MDDTTQLSACEDWPRAEDWHGWKQGGATLHIGPVPYRKSVCVYAIRGSVMTPLAYCRSEDDARMLLAILDEFMGA